MTDIAILWHMHQPFYEDLVTREHILPWVRLHALKDYYGMVALLREFPDLRMTFNLVPSLLVQLEAFAQDRARDRFLDLSLKPVNELTDGEIAFIRQNFFHAQRHRMIEPYPRYAELLARRDGTAGDGRGAERRFSRDDLRDLQVWHKLVWVDPSYLEEDPRARGLIAKGRGFTEEDKRLLREIELELLNRVIPEYAAAAARGQIELSTSPFYHPILPLLCDTNVYLQTHPESRLPRERFVHPEDAAEQLRRALALHKRLFGRAPIGLWPSEGSVSDAMVPLAADAGFAWMATDELILARTLGMTFSRDAGGYLERPERLYTPYVVRTRGRSIACTFRDHSLSDLIGFTYASWDPEIAAGHFVAQLVEAGRRYTASTGGRTAIISIILDGENAWEHFTGGGRPFLRALYRRLSNTPELRTLTMAEACARAEAELTSIFPGSWIDANFYIWIGHQDDQRGWSQLADARQALNASPGIDPERRAEAEEEVLIAEGSDWFWWYGDDHSSSHDLEFDDLFRRHLRNVYTLLDQPIPDELFLSNISTLARPGSETPPSAFITPTIDGEETSYFEWLGAGALEIRDVASTMQRTDRAGTLLTTVQYGFDPEHLYVRLDAAGRMYDVLNSGYRCTLVFLRPNGIRVSIAVDGRGSRATLARNGGGGDRTWTDQPSLGVVAATGTVTEVRVPLADLGLAPGAPLVFFVAIVDADGHEVERHPTHRPLELTVPDERFEAGNWTA